MGSTSKSGRIPIPVQPQELVDTRKRVAELADKELAGEMSGDTKASIGTALHAEKIDDIRRKVESGYYERDDIKKLIADRLSSGLRGQ